MLLEGLECRVSKLVHSDTCPHERQIPLSPGTSGKVKDNLDLRASKISLHGASPRGFARIVASETEGPNVFTDLV